MKQKLVSKQKGVILNKVKDPRQAHPSAPFQAFYRSTPLKRSEERPSLLRIERKFET